MKSEVTYSQELVCRPKGNRPTWVAWPGEAASEHLGYQTRDYEN